MADPAQIDLIADRRVSFDELFSFLEVDWTGSTFKVQVRLVKDTTSTPLISETSPTGIGLTYAGTDTVANHISAGRLAEAPDGYASGDSLMLSQIFLFFDCSAFPFPDERGDDMICWYDVIRIPAAGLNEMAMRGQLIVRAGVTIP